MNRDRHLRQMKTLLLREYWEHRISVFWVPAFLSALLSITLIWALLRLDIVPSIINQFTLLLELPAQQAREQLLTTYWMAGGVFALTLMFTIPIYLLVCLYDDRKSSSSLFWYSMPISNTKTVLSKLLTATLVMPVMSILLLFAFLLLAWILATLLSGMNNMGLQVSWLVGHTLVLWLLNVLVLIVLTGIWMLPVYGYLLLVSAFARAVPFFWAIGVLMGLALLENIIFSSSHFSAWLGTRGIPYQLASTQSLEMIGNFMNLETLHGLLIGALLITGAVYMRRFND